jgi:hypothetical protein
MMAAAIPLLLCLLAMTDAAFCGFRAAAGRDARIFKNDYFRRAIRRGLAQGFLTSALVAAGIAGMLLLSPAPLERLAELSSTARSMLWVLFPYATLVLAALGVWLAAEADARTLASVLLLGPFTLIRPWVIVAAAVVGALYAPNLAVALAAVGACGLQLTIEPLLDWRYTRATQTASKGE